MQNLKGITGNSGSDDKLQIKSLEKQLEDKEIVIKSLIEQTEIEKDVVKKHVLNNVEQVIFPVLKLLKKNASKEQCEYIEHLNKNLKDLVSPFDKPVRSSFNCLTPKETQICHMIATGMTNKEIAKANNVSPLTIHTHRNRIRKKLGLIKQKMSLIKYLRSR